MKFKLLCLLLLLIFELNKTSANENITVNGTNILFLTDIHLDVLYNSKTSNKENFFLRCKNATNYTSNEINSFDYGRYNCNPSEVLLKMALKSAKEKYPKVNLIILGGDMIAHGLYKLNIEQNSKHINKNLYKKTFQTIYSVIREYYNEVKILPILGNNDYYEHYQTPDENSKKEQIDFMKQLYFTKEGMFNFEDFNKNFDETINKGMFYSYFDKNLGMNFIVLNSVLFSSKNKKINETEASFQFKFLKTELKKIEKKDQKAFVMMHIPPYPQISENNTLYLFHEQFTIKLEKILFKYKNTVINVLSGHTHWAKIGVRGKPSDQIKFPKIPLNKDEWKLAERFMRFKSFLPIKPLIVKYMSTISFPGLSPIFYNNPGYSIITFNSEKKIIANINSFYANLNKTLDPSKNYEFSLNIEVDPEILFNIRYDFLEDYSFTDFTHDDFYDFIYNRLEKEKIFNKYIKYIGGFCKDSNLLQTETYYKLLLSKGMLDFETNFFKFKCSHKMLYQEEFNQCQ